MWLVVVVAWMKYSPLDMAWLLQTSQILNAAFPTANPKKASENSAIALRIHLRVPANKNARTKRRAFQ
jgi:hypothetical protein